MGKLQPSGGIRNVWSGAGYVPGAPTKRCCTACRRGTPAFGETTCGYDGNCPNGCHEKEPK